MSSEGFRVVARRVGEGFGLLGREAQVGQQAPARALRPSNVFFYREYVASGPQY